MFNVKARGNGKLNWRCFLAKFCNRPIHTRHAVADLNQSETRNVAIFSTDWGCVVCLTRWYQSQTTARHTLTQCLFVVFGSLNRPNGCKAAHRVTDQLRTIGWSSDAIANSWDFVYPLPSLFCLFFVLFCFLNYDISFLLFQSHWPFLFSFWVVLPIHGRRLGPAFSLATRPALVTAVIWNRRLGQYSVILWSAPANSLRFATTSPDIFNVI